MANLSNINNILRTSSLGVGINCDAEFSLDIEKASANAILSLNSNGGSGAEYLLSSTTSGEFVLNKRYVGDRLTISSGGDATFAGNVTTPQINLNSAGGGIIDNQTGNIFIQTPSGTGWIFRNGPSGYDEKMRIDSSGNVGIGTTSPSEKLVVQDGKILAGHTNTRGYGFHDLSNYTYTANTGRLSLVSNGIEAVSIDSSQKVGIGTTSPTYGKITVTESGSAYTGDYIYGGTNGSYGALRCTLSASNSPSFIDFFRSSYSTTVPVGAIVTSGSNCLYQSYSDYRMKENVSELTGALDKVNNIQPKTFNYKEDTETTYQGFIAHELQEIVPQAVSGKKDEVNEDGTPKYQGVDNSHIVPLLVGAIQELKAEIELLKTQINN